MKSVKSLGKLSSFISRLQICEHLTVEILFVMIDIKYNNHDKFNAQNPLNIGYLWGTNIFQ